MMTWPKPVQKPHPPVILGGAFPWAARRAIRYGDGWYPNASQRQARGIHAGASARWPQEAGRDPKSLSVTFGGAPDDPDKLKRFRDLGVDARQRHADRRTRRDEILPMLDRWAKLKQQVQ